jgi:hypothetical protein
MVTSLVNMAAAAEKFKYLAAAIGLQGWSRVCVHGGLGIDLPSKRGLSNPSFAPSNQPITHVHTAL